MVVLVRGTGELTVSLVHRFGAQKRHGVQAGYAVGRVMDTNGSSWAAVLGPEEKQIQEGASRNGYVRSW